MDEYSGKAGHNVSSIMKYDKVQYNITVSVLVHVIGLHYKALVLMINESMPLMNDAKPTQGCYA